MLYKFKLRLVFICFNVLSIVHRTVIIITINTVTQLYENRKKKKIGRVYKLNKKVVNYKKLTYSS